MIESQLDIQICYQPIVMLHDRSLHGFEALVRAMTPDGTLLGADQVVDAMVDGETSLALTRRIMAKAVADYDRYGFGDWDIPFSFNIPLDGLLHADLLRSLTAVRMRDARRGRGLSIELTERQPVRDVAAVDAVVIALRAAGYEVMLDDITPDTENLEALLAMPLSAVKLDGSVVNGDGARERAFIDRIVAWSRSHCAGVIAEGIETAEVGARMLTRGIRYGQGFLYARPLPPEALGGFREGQQHETA